MGVVKSAKFTLHLLKTGAVATWYLIRHQKLVRDLSDTINEQLEAVDIFFDTAQDCPYCEVSIDDDTGSRTIGQLCKDHKEQYKRIVESPSDIEAVFRAHGMGPQSGAKSGGDTDE